MEEFEAKFLNVDPAEIERKVLAQGGRKVFDRMFHRAVFDYADLRLDKQASWLRVRDEGDQVTMAFKQRTGTSASDGSSNDGGMLEEEVTVSDFATACRILRHIGLEDKFFIENRRVRYELGDAQLDVDWYPQLEPFLEIEGPSWEAVDMAIVKLGLDPKDKKVFSATQIYAIKGIRDKDYSRITFDEMVKNNCWRPGRDSNPRRPP